MNKARRQKIEQAIALIEQAREILENAADEERDYYDSMPESIHGGEKGSAAEAATDALEEAAMACDDVIAQAQRAISS